MDLGWGQAFSSNISTPLELWQGGRLYLVSGLYYLRPLDHDCISENTSLIFLFLIGIIKTVKFCLCNLWTVPSENNSKNPFVPLSTIQLT